MWSRWRPLASELRSRTRCQSGWRTSACVVEPREYVINTVQSVNHQDTDSAQAPTTTRRAGSRRTRTPYGWLGASALGVGVWVALAGGIGVAQADGGDSAPAGHVGRGVAAGPVRVVAQRTSAVSRTAGKTTTPAAVVSGARPAAGVRTAFQARRVAAVAASPGARAVVGGGPSASGSMGWQPGSILRAFIGNGTAANPNGGLIIGNGFSYTAATDLFPLSRTPRLRR